MPRTVSMRKARGLAAPADRPRKLLVYAAKNFDADDVMKRIENVELGQLTDQTGRPVNQGLIGAGKLPTCLRCG